MKAAAPPQLDHRSLGKLDAARSQLCLQPRGWRGARGHTGARFSTPRLFPLFPLSRKRPGTAFFALTCGLCLPVPIVPSVPAYFRQFDFAADRVRKYFRESHQDDRYQATGRPMLLYGMAARRPAGPAPAGNSREQEKNLRMRGAVVRCKGQAADFWPPPSALVIAPAGAAGPAKGRRFGAPVWPLHRSPRARHPLRLCRLA